MKKKIMASIEARMTSSRLPGKVLMESLPGVSMLEYMINRVKKSNNIDSEKTVEGNSPASTEDKPSEN